MTISASFVPANGSTTSEASLVSAACNAAQATRETSFSQSWEFKIQTLLDMAKATVPEGSSMSDEEQLLADMAAIKNALNRSGDLAPRVVTRVVRSLGANFRAVGTGTYTLKYGSETIGTATVDQSTLADDKGNSEVTILLTTVPTIAQDGTFTLQFDGKTRLECSTASATVRKANVQLGLAAFKYFTQPFEVIEY